MTDEVSSDVGYVIEQLNQQKNNQNQLQISYNNQQIKWEDRLTKEETQQQPTIQVNNSSNKDQYRTLVMIDPDAPSSEQPITGPFIHWILANCKENDGSDGQAVCPYRGPGPRPGTGQHRYTFLLYESAKEVKEERAFDDIPQRRKFPLAQFVTENQLRLLDVALFTVDAE